MFELDKRCFLNKLCKCASIGPALLKKLVLRGMWPGGIIFPILVLSTKLVLKEPASHFVSTLTLLRTHFALNAGGTTIYLSSAAMRSQSSSILGVSANKHNKRNVICCDFSANQKQLFASEIPSTYSKYKFVLIQLQMQFKDLLYFICFLLGGFKIAK